MGTTHLAQGPACICIPGMLLHCFLCCTSHRWSLLSRLLKTNISGAKAEALEVVYLTSPQKYTGHQRGVFFYGCTKGSPYTVYGQTTDIKRHVCQIHPQRHCHPASELLVGSAIKSATTAASMRPRHEQQQALHQQR